MGMIFLTSEVMEAVRGQNLPYKQGYVTPVPAAVVVNTYEFRKAEDPSCHKRLVSSTNVFKNVIVISK